MLPLVLALLVAQPPAVRPIPPKGLPVPAADLADITAGLGELRAALDALPKTPAVDKLRPDVEVLHKAVRWAVDYDEFLAPKDAQAAKRLLKLGLERAAELKAGKPTWPTATGLVVRGYRSKIDGSLQPYGLVVPASYSPTTPHRFRLDVWWRGRSETAAEVGFLADRLANPGQFVPKDAFVLHPFGRYCNANKFAGEVDTFEALDHVKANYPIDEKRLVARGFSMGGAACWQFATHHPTMWCAAAPGAGFAETPEFLRLTPEQLEATPWWEKKLWRWYNSTDHAANLVNLPTVAYSGEADKQKQAADVMARELAKQGVELRHVIGAKEGHKYTQAAKDEINRRIDASVARGRHWTTPAKFTTHTLRYNSTGLVRVDGLERHWEPATVQAFGAADVNTRNVAALTLAAGPGDLTPPLVVGNSPEAPALIRQTTIDGQPVVRPLVGSDGSLLVHFRKLDGKWRRVDSPAVEGLSKKPGLQGPIDDAFLEKFLHVRPTGQPLHEATGNWVAAELPRALREWRRTFRGDAPVADDTAVTDADIASSNLILWGDPQSNKLLARVLDKLPLRWTADALRLGDGEHDARTCLPLLVYPNPLNPAKYVVLNSGFTFREKHHLSNADQVPKLPDYAILDTATPPDARSPGKVLRAGFFGERWEPLPDDGR